MKWKNIDTESPTYFITATINKWQPLFNYDIPKEILIRDLEFYRNKYNASFHAYVLMPDHYHILLTLPAPSALHNWLRDIHSHSANEISKWLRSIEGAEKIKIKGMRDILTMHSEKKSKLTIWKEQARAESIFSRHTVQQKINYIHENPVRKNLVLSIGDWSLSSWRNYHYDVEGNLPIDKISID